MTVATLNELFLDACRQYADRPAALRFKRSGQWISISQQQLHTRVHHVHAALRESGLAVGDRIAILSENRPEWAITDYAALTARLVDVPVYPSLPAGQIAYVLRDSGARMVFLSSATQLAKLQDIRHELPELRQVVCFDEVASGPDTLNFSAFEATGAAAAARHAEWETLARQALPEDLATLIYTSGTTGDPKGVMLTHRNITSNVVAALEVLDMTVGWDCLSFLPLSHIFERMVGHYTMMRGGLVINYATSFEAVATELAEVRPQFLASVPRLYEKIHTRVMAAVESGPSLRRAIFEWARATSDRLVEYRLQGGTPPSLLRLAGRLADRLVFRKLRDRLGGRLEFAVSGGAPLSPEICRFFLAAGVPILEGYGLTETSPVITVNRLERIKPGTVGPPIREVEVRIADDGEILSRGPHIMRGYYRLPEATAEAIDADGWFHTGDIGELDADGYLRITDRKKDLIVTAGGKNIAPQPIEALLKAHPLLSHAVMLGDRRPFPVMLLVPDFAELGKWASAHGMPDLSPAQLAINPVVRDHLEGEARKALRNLAHFEMPKKFLILPSEFSIAGGELTPKLSVRRKVVAERWKAEIDALYPPDNG